MLNVLIQLHSFQIITMLFFAGYDNVSWIIGPDYKQLSGSFVNYKTKGTGIPQTGWSYYDAESKTFIQDDTNIVVKGKYIVV